MYMTAANSTYTNRRVPKDPFDLCPRSLPWSRILIDVYRVEKERTEKRKVNKQNYVIR